MPDQSTTTLSADQLAALERHAEAAAHHAYAPYSRFFVGAAILLESGETVTGCNVENASYRLTSCAEQSRSFGRSRSSAPPSASAPSPSPT